MTTSDTEAAVARARPPPEVKLAPAAAHCETAAVARWSDCWRPDHLSGLACFREARTAWYPFPAGEALTPPTWHLVASGVIAGLLVPKFLSVCVKLFRTNFSLFDSSRVERSS